MNRFTKLFGLGVFALGLGVAAQSASADVLKDIVKRGELRVAVQTQGPPVSFIDKNGERTGFAIEVVKMMAEDMGVKLKLLDFDWKGLIPAINSGKADFLAADMTPNAKRTLVLSFTEPYLYSDVVIYSKKVKSFVLLGDFNLEPKDPAYDHLVGPLDGELGRISSQEDFVDTWVVAGHDEHEGVTYTSDASSSDAQGIRIDYAFVDESMKNRVLGVWIDESAQGSDHQPYWLDLKYAPHD